MSENKSEYKVTSTRFVAFTAVFSALLALLSSVRVPMPPPLYSISLFSLGIFVVGTLFGPRIGFLAGGIGGAIAEVYSVAGASLSGSDAGIFVISAFVAKGASGLVIGYGREVARALSQVKIATQPGTLAFIEALAMAFGRTAELTIFFTIDAFLYGIPAALTDYLGMLTLIIIPIALAINEAVRRAFGRRYFDV